MFRLKLIWQQRITNCGPFSPPCSPDPCYLRCGPWPRVGITCETVRNVGSGVPGQTFRVRFQMIRCYITSVTSSLELSAYPWQLGLCCLTLRGRKIKTQAPSMSSIPAWNREARGGSLHPVQGELLPHVPSPFPPSTPVLLPYLPTCPPLKSINMSKTLQLKSRTTKHAQGRKSLPPLHCAHSLHKRGLHFLTSPSAVKVLNPLEVAGRVGEHKNKDCKSK